MRNAPIAVLVSTVAMLGSSSAALAWDDYGHELVASIAYRGLNPDAKARVDALLKQHPQREALAAGCPAGFDEGEWVFMRAATWPDMVRSTSNPFHKSDHHSKWHYINLPLEKDGVKGTAPTMVWKPGADPENAVQALVEAEAELKDASLGDGEKARALCWYLHLTGDIHQPLHATNLYSSDFPKGDEGGNLFWVATSEGHPVKLHSFWDQCLGTGKDLKRISERGVQLVTQKELTRKTQAARVEKSAYADWATESAEVCRVVVYQEMTLKGAKAGQGERAPKDATPIPEGYQAKAEKIAECQVVLAGYRLADKLNQRLITAAPSPASK